MGRNLSTLGLAVFLVLICPLIGVFLIKVGRYSDETDKRFLIEGTTARASVTKKFISQGAHGDLTTLTNKQAGLSSYWIDFTFKDEKGRVVNSDSSVEQPFYDSTSVGDDVTVAYVKTDPNINRLVTGENPQMDRAANLGFLVLGAGLIASPLLFGSGWLFWKRIRSQKPSLKTSL